MLDPPRNDSGDRVTLCDRPVRGRQRATDGSDRATSGGVGFAHPPARASIDHRAVISANVQAGWYTCMTAGDVSVSRAAVSSRDPSERALLISAIVPATSLASIS